MTILRPIFGRGVAQRRLGAEVPELHQKFPLLLGTQSSNLILQKNLPSPLKTDSVFISKLFLGIPINAMPSYETLKLKLKLNN